MERLLGGIEAGGTKFVCAVGDAASDLRAQARFPTTTPEETIGRAVDFLLEQEEKFGPLAAVGIASFGPVDLSRTSPTYGHITNTPKPGWAKTDFLGRIRQSFDCPIGFDTDVNAAALAEWRWGAARGADVAVYMTIGTGIGGGVVVNGRPLHGLIHPEMGHSLPPHDREADPFPGICPYHGDCLEGLACGLAMERRWGRKTEELPPDHPAWDLEAGYLAWEAANLTCTLSPQKIIFGGGVMKQARLFPLIRAKTSDLLAGYIQSKKITEEIDAYIVPPQLGDCSGIHGAIALADLAG